METVINSVMTVGLLPAYGKYPNSKVFSIGGVTSNSTPRVKITWTDMNSDTMRPVKTVDTATTIANLPHVDGSHGTARRSHRRLHGRFQRLRGVPAATTPGRPVDGFAGLTIRKVVRPTRFYYMLLQRLRDHRTMDDGIVWSAQADFAARLADWEHDSDPAWPLQRAERAAVVELNVPHFVMASDGHEIRDAAGTSIAAEAHVRPRSARPPGCAASTNAKIAWQAEVIRQNTARSGGRRVPALSSTGSNPRTRPVRPAVRSSPPKLTRSARTLLRACDSQGAERGVDRARLARRLRGVSARRARARPLQRRVRHRPVPRRTRRRRQTPCRRGTLRSPRWPGFARRSWPQPGANGSLARPRRGDSAWDRLCTSLAVISGAAR